MKTSFHNFSGDFANYLRNEKGAPQLTADAYCCDIEVFRKWFVKTLEDDFDLDAITSIDLREYRDYLLALGRKPATINRNFASMKAFLKWAREAGHLDRAPSFPKLPSQQRTSPKALDRKDQNRLLRELERDDGKYRARDHALIRLMMSCGLRVSEAIALQVSDLILGERKGKAIVRHGKGSQWRDVYIPPETRKTISEWLAHRDDGSPWLFPNGKGSHISRQYAGKILRKFSRLSGLEKLHPHVLRHTCATNLVRTGTDLVTVAKILGHTSVNTTAVYTQPSEQVEAEALDRGEA